MKLDWRIWRGCINPVGVSGGCFTGINVKWPWLPPPPRHTGVLLWRKHRLRYSCSICHLKFYTFFIFLFPSPLRNYEQQRWGQGFWLVTRHSAYCRPELWHSFVFNYMAQTSLIVECRGHLEDTFIHACTRICKLMMVKRAGSWGWLWFPVFPYAGRINSSDCWMMDPPCSQHWLQGDYHLKIRFLASRTMWGKMTISSHLFSGELSQEYEGGSWQPGGEGGTKLTPRWCKQVCTQKVAYFQALLPTWSWTDKFYLINPSWDWFNTTNQQKSSGLTHTGGLKQKRSNSSRKWLNIILVSYTWKKLNLLSVKIVKLWTD